MEKHEIKVCVTESNIAPLLRILILGFATIYAGAIMSSYSITLIMFTVSVFAFAIYDKMKNKMLGHVIESLQKQLKEQQEEIGQEYSKETTIVLLQNKIKEQKSDFEYQNTIIYSLNKKNREQESEIERLKQKPPKQPKPNITEEATKEGLNPDGCLHLTKKEIAVRREIVTQAKGKNEDPLTALWAHIGKKD